MGTSSMYTGPSGNPLLPRDFEDVLSPEKENNEGINNTDEENQNESNNSGSTNEAYPGNEDNSNNNVWREAKSNMSRLASGNSTNYRKTVSSYVKAHGGAKNASKSASSGIKSTVSLGGFISNSYRSGIQNVLDNYQMKYEGRSAKDILTDVINVLAPIPITKEDSVARKALIRTMEVLYEMIEDENNDISTLDKIDKGLLNRIIPIQIESYIYERIINDLGYRIETKSSSPTDAINLENEIKEYIKSKVETTLKGKDFSNFEFIEKKVESLFNQCYRVMEDML